MISLEFGSACIIVASWVICRLLLLLERIVLVDLLRLHRTVDVSHCDARAPTVLRRVTSLNVLTMLTANRRRQDTDLMLLSDATHLDTVD